MEHTLDRIDVDGNYEQTNCRWATNDVQARNRGTQQNNKSGYTGVKWYAATKKWAVTINIDRKRIHLGYFEDINEAAQTRKQAEIKYWKKESS